MKHGWKRLSGILTLAALSAGSGRQRPAEASAP